MKQVHDEIGLAPGPAEEIRRIGTEHKNVVAGGMGSGSGDRIGGVGREGIVSVDIERSVAILVAAVEVVGPEGEIVVVIQGRGGMSAPPWAAVEEEVVGVGGDGGVRRHFCGDASGSSRVIMALGDASLVFRSQNSLTFLFISFYFIFFSFRGAHMIRGTRKS